MTKSHDEDEAIIDALLDRLEDWQPVVAYGNQWPDPDRLTVEIVVSRSLVMECLNAKPAPKSE